MAKIKINSERCKGCELCVISCPCRIIVMEGPINSFGLKTAKARDLKACKGCSICAIVCPDCAITVWK